MCYMSLSEIIYSSYLSEESVPDGEKIISHSSFNLNILLRLSLVIQKIQ
jgi:hypothetical protein